MKVYSYVIVVDDGGAPNFERPFATLAICKPKIRLKAEPGDLVLSFTGRSLWSEPDAVRWAGVVEERLTFGDYWNDKRFANKKPGAAKTKPDNIYYPEGQKMLKIENEKHGPKNARTDLSGRYVLVFDPYWKLNYRSREAILPEKFGLRIVGQRQGHRVTAISKEEWRELKKWLNHAPRDDRKLATKRQC
jgi:Nucleotide modification associated domain 2